MSRHITDTAQLKCDKGTAPAPLSVTSQTFMQIEGRLQATEADIQPNVNIKPFGVCSVTRSSCAPAPIKWQDTSVFEIDGNRELLDCSTCQCSAGGTISIIQPAQSFVEEAGGSIYEPIEHLLDDEDNNGNGNDIEIEECVCDDWETVPSVIPANKFVGYTTDCHAATHKQLNVMGYKEGFPRYQIAKAIRNTKKEFISMQYYKDEFVKGVDYIKTALKKGIPVTIGVDNHEEITPGNPDLTTDHFVVIVGMDSDSNNGNYFHFYDNASHSVGTSLENKLYCDCKNSKLVGKTDDLSTYGKGYTYTVTSIRTSVKK